MKHTAFLLYHTRKYLKVAIRSVNYLVQYIETYKLSSYKLLFGNNNIIRRSVYPQCTNNC